MSTALSPTPSLQGLAGTSAAAAAAAGLQTLPPMPEPPIFDAPFNPYYGALAEAMKGMNDTQKMQFQPFIVEQILTASRNKSMDQSRIVIGGYALVLLFCLVLLAYMRHNRHLAMKGDSDATRKIILPAFEPMLWFLAALTVAYVAFFTATISADFITVRSTLVTVEFIYATKQFLFLFVPIYLLQKALSVQALLRASLVTFLVSVYTIPFAIVMFHYGRASHQRLCYFLLFAVRWLTFVPMVYYCLHPPSRASRRSFHEYAFYYAMTQALYLASCEAFRQGSVYTSLTLSWITVAWNATCPFFIWRLLKADTEHWRGMGNRAVELQSRFRRKGKIEERISAKGLHVLIELHRKYIIDFASLDIQHKISEAENAMVFRGRLHTKQTPVAIKVYTPETFNEDTVAEYSHEAALCGALRHPNIVQFYGLCVCPPTICLVTELCQGSLRDVTRSMAKKTRQNAHRQQFLINVGYMIDAARAIAYLHSFSPAFVHRDIKPDSFLVDSDGGVKLTDFGASRTLTNMRSASGHQHEHEIPIGLIGDQQAEKKTHKGPRGMAEIMGNLRAAPEYMAPEVIRSKHAGTSKYGEAADIYALAMTMWDILYPNESKYHSTVHTAVSDDMTGNRVYSHRGSDIFECVFAGQRPFLDERMYPPLRELLQTAWHADPRLRPSAQNIVHVLEAIQEETCSVYALELIEALECGSAHATLRAARPGLAHPPPPSSQSRRVAGDVSQISFPGSRAIEKMYALEHVAREHEAVRLGNMLLDAGFLHHIKHARSFEYSAALYFFDEEQIHLCQPLAMLEEGAVSTEQEQAALARGGRPRYTQQTSDARFAKRHAHNSDSSSAHHAPPPQAQAHRGRHDSSQQGSHVLMDNLTGLVCACRKLGQKIESAQTARRRLRLKFKASDEHLVTARLLAEETPGADFGDAAYNNMGRMT